MDRKKALKRLGYTEKWLESGVISEAFLMNQYEEISSSEDKNAEHYRFRGFRLYLESKNSLSDSEIRNIFRLRDDGPDRCDLHLNRIHELIRSPLLSDRQFSELSEYSEISEPSIQKIYRRIDLIRKMKTDGLTERLFEKICGSDDSELHRHVLKCDELKRSHALWLSEHGSNKAVRNIAMQMLKNKHFGKSEA